MNTDSTKVLTKEEIMWSVLNKKPINYEIDTDEVLECMDIWAKQEAIAFAEWLGEGLEMRAIGGKWECLSMGYCDKHNLQLDVEYDTQNLYTIYQQSKKQ